MKRGIFLIALVIIAGLFYASAFVVDEREQVIVTRFKGQIVGDPITEAGLKWKIPFIDKANYFPKNLQEWDGDPGQIPTLDKTYIWVDAFARWKIVNPIKFFRTLNNMRTAIARLDDIIDPAVRNFITSYQLIETVRRSNRELDTFELGLEDIKKDHTKAFQITLGREKITEGIMLQAQPKLDQFGIELVDVKIKRLNYVEQVRKSVYNRMIAERKQIAEKFRSEGAGEANKIIGEKDRDLKEIISGAYKTAQELMGTADGKASRIYADAYNPDPEFYSFYRTLEIYGDTFDEQSSLVLSTDSEFLKYLKGFSE